MIAHAALLIAVILVAAKVGGEVATRLKQPPVVGELLAGMALGALPFRFAAELGSNAAVDMLSHIGILLLLFEVGLESTVRDVLAVGKSASRVAVLGTIGSFCAGYAAALLALPRASPTTHVFLGASITATSIGITARVVKDLGLTRAREARTILGAAVLDDVLGLVVLALVTSGLHDPDAGRREITPILWSIGKTALFLASSIVVGMKVTPHIFSMASRLRTRGALLALGLAFCFFLSWLAERVGVAAIIGAFAAGLVLEDLHSTAFVARGEQSLARQIEPISGFLVPIFFVVMGLHADVRVFAHAETSVLAGALILAAVVGKLACALGAESGSQKIAVALGMLPRGEVTLVYASIGIASQTAGVRVLDERAYAALVAVVVATTLITPSALKWALIPRPKLLEPRSRAEQ